MPLQPLLLFLLAVASLHLPHTARAQTPDTAAAIPDSYRQRLDAIERQRIADSVQRATLQEELRTLRTTDGAGRAALEARLRELSQKDSLGRARKAAQIDSLRASNPGFPVMGFFEDTLFRIYARQGSFPAAERAAAISARIRTLTDATLFGADSLTLVTAESSTDVVMGQQIIVAVSEDDALWNNTDRATLAARYKATIAAAVKSYRAETGLWAIGKEVGLALLVLVVLWLIIRYLGRAFRWTARKIVSQQGNRIRGFKVGQYSLFDDTRMVKVLLTANNLIKWFAILLAIYLALPVIFGLFPGTRHFADALFSYILAPVRRTAAGLWGYLPNLITIVVIIYIFRWVLKGLYFLRTEIEAGNLRMRGFYPDWAAPTHQIVKVLVFAFMIVVLFPYLPGSESPVFKGVSVFLGFLFTFGSAGSLSNVVAGLVLTYMRLFVIGDRVKIGEVTGDVIEKSLLVTRVRTIKNEIISIPNSTVMTSHTVNYSADSADRGLIIHTTVTIGYDVPWREMHAALLEAASRVDAVLKEPSPFVLQTGLEDFYVAYQINAYTREAGAQARIYSDLHAAIQDCCNERGIEILSPHYRAARDGNETTIPKDYRAPDYRVPGFRVEG